MNISQRDDSFFWNFSMQGTDLHVLVTEVARPSSEKNDAFSSKKNSRDVYLIYSRYLIIYHLSPLFPRCLGASLTSPRPVLPFILTREHIVKRPVSNRGIRAANYWHPRTRRTARKRGAGDVETQAFASRGCERITSDGESRVPSPSCARERRGSRRESIVGANPRESATIDDRDARARGGDAIERRANYLSSCDSWPLSAASPPPAPPFSASPFCSAKFCSAISSLKSLPS